MKRDIVRGIKGIEMEIDALRRRFYSKSIITIRPEEEMQEEVVEYIYEHNDELSKILKKMSGLENIDVNDIKVECWFWSKELHSYCTIDLDDYYGGAFQGYRYKLIVGGKNHGNLVANGYHEDNANDMDIVYKLEELNNSEYDTYTNALRNMVQKYFDYWDPIKQSNREKLDAFSKYIRNHRVKMVTDVYKKLAASYSYILDYSAGGGEMYSVLLRHSDVLLTDVNRILNGIDVDHDYFARCRELKTLITQVQNDMRDWYNNVYIYVGKIAENNIGVSDISQNILDFV